MVAALLLAAGVGAAAGASPCGPLPRAGPPVPAPIVFATTCGAVRLGRDGSVTRLPRRWLAAHGSGTGRRFGADLRVGRSRSGALTLTRRGRLVWRAGALYPNDGGSVAFGPGRFAFAAYRRGVLLTDLRSPERLVVRGRGRYPLGFTAAGRLVVAGGGEIVVVSPVGAVERRLRHRARSGVAFDERAGVLRFVTRSGRLASLRESRLAVAGRLPAVARRGWIGPAGADGALLVTGERSLALLRADGTLVASARWPARPRLRLDGVGVSPDGRRVAFRLSDARPGARRGTAAVFLLDAGRTRATPFLRHRLGTVGCASGATLRWQGRYLLYGSSDGRLAVLDAARGTHVDLTGLAGRLERPGARPLAAWASDF